MKRRCARCGCEFRCRLGERLCNACQPQVDRERTLHNRREELERRRLRDEPQRWQIMRLINASQGIPEEELQRLRSAIGDSITTGVGYLTPELPETPKPPKTPSGPPANKPKRRIQLPKPEPEK